MYVCTRRALAVWLTYLLVLPYNWGKRKMAFVEISSFLCQKWDAIISAVESLHMVERKTHFDFKCTYKYNTYIITNHHIMSFYIMNSANLFTLLLLFIIQILFDFIIVGLFRIDLAAGPNSKRSCAIKRWVDLSIPICDNVSIIFLDTDPKQKTLEISLKKVSIRNFR